MVSCRLLQKRILCWPTLTNIWRLVGSWILTLLISWSKSYHILWFVLYIPMKKCHAPIVFPSKTMIFPLIYTWNGHFFPTDFPWTTRRWEFWTAQSPTSPFTELSQQLLPQAGCIHLCIHTVHIYYYIYICIMYQINLMTCICVAMILYNYIYIYREREKELYCII